MADDNKRAITFHIFTNKRKIFAIYFIFILAFLLRMSAIWPLGIYHPDEIFQYLEQAHRLTFGYGVIPWEYRYGMRGGLVSVLLGAAMKVGDFIAPNSFLYWQLPHILGAILSLGVIWAAYNLGRQFSFFVALLSAFVAATWYEIVLFAAHPLTESLSFSAFMPAAYLLLSNNKNKNHIIISGFLLGLSALLRFQYLPAITFLTLFILKNKWKSWLFLIIGAAIALFLSCIADLAIGQIPLLWFFENIQQNLIYHRSDDYGISPLYTYFSDIHNNWKILFIILPWPILKATRYYPSLLGTALVNIIFHMLIAHKEYRFVFLSSGILIILGAIGSALLVEEFTKYWSILPKKLLKISIFIFWGGASLLCSTPNVIHWYQYNGILLSEKDAKTIPNLCGLIFFHIPYWKTGGYSLLHKNIPIYILSSSISSTPISQTMESLSPAVNAVITPITFREKLPAEYRIFHCHNQKNEKTLENICIFVRHGKCAIRKNANNLEINEVLKNMDQ
ncbi:MAG: mannosyltransferase [Zymomonas mobilis subsp. pomaceae]|uniref:mannosyltransferase n=1 Tax=Zymomonas mobilis TaxID=542 RepID=UPI0039EC3A50